MPEPVKPASPLRAEDGSLNSGCTDKRGYPTWSCREWDGTGLWCDSCLAVENAPSGECCDPLGIQCTCAKARSSLSESGGDLR